MVFMLRSGSAVEPAGLDPAQTLRIAAVHIGPIWGTVRFQLRTIRMGLPRGRLYNQEPACSLADEAFS